MSTSENTMWLESAKETFEEAVAVENWTLCRAVIDDVRDISPGSALVLERELEMKQNAPSVDELIDHLGKKTGMQI